MCDSLGKGGNVPFSLGWRCTEKFFRMRALHRDAARPDMPDRQNEKTKWAKKKQKRRQHWQQKQSKTSQPPQLHRIPSEDPFKRMRARLLFLQFTGGEVLKSALRRLSRSETLERDSGASPLPAIKGRMVASVRTEVFILCFPFFFELIKASPMHTVHRARTCAQHKDRVCANVGAFL